MSALLIVPFLVILLILLIFGLVFGLFGFWVWMIVDCATNEEFKGNDKIVWILIVIFTGWVGALIYFFVQKPKKTAKARQQPQPPPPRSGDMRV
jgi:NADH:ubiquinone oxidoreductase subunit 6 (subunit J)